jgi:hypothetical protein
MTNRVPDWLAQAGYDNSNANAASNSSDQSHWLL